MQYDVLDRIREQYKGMSKGHNRLIGIRRSLLLSWNIMTRQCL